MFGGWYSKYRVETKNGLEKLRTALDEANAVVIGAGSGLSTSAGFTYAGERFEKYFSDFAEKFGIKDMYSGGFYPFPDMETYWAWWSRHIWINRYEKAPKPVYEELRKLVEEKDYFVITTNVDHQFQMAGFDKKRLFYTQGDYGLVQCSKPCHKETYDNRELMEQMLRAQGYEIGEDGRLVLPDGVTLKMKVPMELIPHCPVCGELMTVNLRCDGTFVEDEGWHQAAERYSVFLRRHQNLKTVFIDAGTGMNTPTIIKFAFWRMTNEWPSATYVCLNKGETYAPEEIRDQAICINDDIGVSVGNLR